MFTHVHQAKSWMESHDLQLLSKTMFCNQAVVDMVAITAHGVNSVHTA